MVYQKIDYINAMVYQSSINEVLEALKVPKTRFMADVIDLVQRGKRDNIASRFYLGSAYYRVEFCSASFCVPEEEYLRYKDEFDNIDSFCDFKFSFVYLDLTGQGLDYLRSIGSCVDQVISNQMLFGEMDTPSGLKVPRFKPTRVDFAYDFVNVEDNFIRDLSDFLHECISKDVNCLITENNQVSPTFSCKVGAKEKTFYIGSTSSEQVLRIYDKGLQLCKNGVFKKKPDWMDFEIKNDPNFEFKSWFRFECQTRKETTHGYLFGYGGDLDRIFEKFCSYYKICYPRHFGKDLWKKRVPIFEKLLDYATIKKDIGLNDYYFWTSHTTVAEKADSMLKKYTKPLFALLADPNVDFRNRINTFVRSLYNSEDPKDQLAYESLISYLAAYCYAREYDDFSSMDIVLEPDGCVQLSDIDGVPRTVFNQQVLFRQETERENRYLKDVIGLFIQCMGGLSRCPEFKKCMDDVSALPEYNGFNAWRDYK